MENNKTGKTNINLEEQDAPLKNTDKAFVQVNRDGTPLMPGNKEADKEADKEDTIEKR
jgi:hypothetical protein